jgi:cytochrome o ubiquinol oxidase operon protein cyoD
MSKQPPETNLRPDDSHGTLRTYVMGFVLSLALTLLAFFMVNKHVSSEHYELKHGFLIASVVMLAILQLLVQLTFFLHLDREKRPYWNLQVLALAVIVVGIVVGGSLWIMNNLDYHIMESPQETEQFIIQDEGVKPHTHSH